MNANGTPVTPEETAPAWSSTCIQALGILIASAILGLAVNALSDKPVPLFDKKGPGAPPERATRMSVSNLKEALDAKKAILLLDVRHPDKFQTAHPTGAKNAPAEEFLEYYSKLNLANLLRAAEEVIVLCDSEQCPSADRVAKTLRTFKHENVNVLQDGWNAYQSSGLPIEKGGQ